MLEAKCKPAVRQTLRPGCRAQGPGVQSDPKLYNLSKTAGCPESVEQAGRGLRSALRDEGRLGGAGGGGHFGRKSWGRQRASGKLKGPGRPRWEERLLGSGRGLPPAEWDQRESVTRAQRQSPLPPVIPPRHLTGQMRGTSCQKGLGEKHHKSPAATEAPRSASLLD